MVFEHLVDTPEPVAAQRHLPELNSPVCVFVGADHGWRFYEECCRSGVEAAAALGAPW
ncbi:hypothetical protein [Streptomyces sp. NPDC006012]|uniref:hypothetical protein n=1 Tax=Streptomyces sp. NPDC006012 TaxID=3364739 RepID=UPI00368D2055